MKLSEIKKNLKIKFKIFNIKYLILFVFCSLFFILPALAQTLNTGLEFGAYTGLVDTDIRIIVARIIRAALGLLGIVALALLIYGGYEYMTAAGNEEQISKAKKILLNAAIGLAIILSAFAITQFVISKLTDAIIGSYTSQYCQQNPSASECSAYCAQHPAECGQTPTGSATSTPSAVHCQDVLKNFDEAGIDCGGSCSKCEGNQCQGNQECQSGWCESGFCVNRPKITQVSPLVAAEGNYITIFGEHFGKYDPTVSQVNFLIPQGTNPETYNKKSMILCQASAWQDNQIVVEVPAGAKTGPLEVVASSTLNLVELGITNSLDSALAGWWTFDSSDVNTTQILDKSGKGKHGAIVGGVVITNGKIGQGGEFDGVDDYVSLAADIMTVSAIRSQGITYSAWIKPAVVRPSVIVGQKPHGGYYQLASGGLRISGGNRAEMEAFDETAGYVSVAGKTTLTADNFYFITGTYNPVDKKMRIYVNGNLENTSSIIGSFSQLGGNGANAIGVNIHSVENNKYPFKGLIDDVRIYNRALSAKEIEQLYQSLGGLNSISLEANSDTTYNDFGPWFDPKEILKIDPLEKRPGLCSLEPKEAAAGSYLNLSGKNFGSSGKVWLGNASADYTSSNQVNTNVLVPVALQTGKTSVKLESNGKQSNNLLFTVLAPLVSSQPHLDYLDPASGPKGAYLTIFGQNFGAAIGKVTFKQGNDIFNAEPLPDYCGNGWSPTQIVVKVPHGLSLGEAEVRVISHQGISSDNYKIYKVDQDKKQANLCKVEPDNGPKDTSVILKGEGFFGDGNGGRVVFSPFDTYVIASNWGDKEISGVKVPSVAVSGPIQTITYINQGAYRSNSLYFKVQNCQTDKNVVCSAGTTCCASGSCLATCPEAVGPKSSVYAWSFSTGKMPIVPKVIEECKNGQVPSPTPSALWMLSDSVCVNAGIRVQFNSLIDDATIDNNSFLVESCDQNCSGEQAVWSPVSGYLDFSLNDGSLYNDFLVYGLGMELFDTVGFRPAPNNLFSKNKWYRVTLTTAIKSLGWNETVHNFDLAANMPAAPVGQCVNPSGKTAAYCFKFKTQDSDELCKLGQAVVSPDPFTATEFNKKYFPEADKTLYKVSAVAQDNICWVINAQAYDWKWNTGDTASDSLASYAEITNDKQGSPPRGKPEQDLITKNIEVSQGKVWARTESGGQTVKDSAALNISPAPVQVVEHWPDCQEACINAAIGARFNTAMNINTLNKQNIVIKICGSDAKCQNSILIANYEVLPWEDGYGFDLEHSLSLDNYYLVIVGGGKNGVQGAAGGTMKEGFSWIFKTKDDSTKCDADRVEIYPASSTVYWVGDKAIYRSLPYGPKDNCAPKTGQLLNASDYNWNWSSADLAVALVSNCVNGITTTTECQITGIDTKIDPLQYATAQSPTAFQQGKSVYLTQIFAQTLNLASQSKQGQADFTLQCGYQNIDSNCPTAGDIDKGVGKNSCCYPRPLVQLIQPAVASNVCPNTAIKLKFDQLMDINSFSSSTLGYYNIILAQATSTVSCPAGQYLVDREELKPVGFWQKVVAFVRHLLGQPVQAEIFCAGGIDYSLSPETIKECPPGTSEEGSSPTCTKDNKIAKTQVSLILKKPLAGLKNYKILVAHPWVKSLAGVSFQNEEAFGFQTRKDICKIDKIEIDPTAWWFNTMKNEADDDPANTTDFDTKNDIDKVFSARAYTNQNVDNAPWQELISYPGVYSWTYQWSVAEETIAQKQAVGTEDQRVKIVAQNKNGATQVGATAAVSDNTNYSASSTVQVFICENPWPDAAFNSVHPEFGLGYVDAFETDDKVLGENPPKKLEVGRGWSNFKLLYCRDAGQPNVAADDLAALRLPTVLYHQGDPTDPVFKEFFFTFDSASNKNSLGLRVYQNLEHRSLLEWYNSQPWIPKGAPVPAKVGPYEALQEGRTYYINGVNVDNTTKTLYSNVYVFSFSDNPTAETLNVVNQLLTNFTLNVNVISQEDKEAFYRDYRRLQDLNLISQKLWNYYQNPKNNSYPKLTENPQLGTYLPSYTNSKWKSWQGVLGNLLGYSLPLDPINKFVGCGSEVALSGLYSWWKAEGDGKDAVGSHDGELKNGAAFEQGKTGQAFKFDGVDDYVKISDATNPTAYTIVAWVKPDKTGKMNIFARTNDSGPAVSWSHQLRIKDNKFEHYLFGSAGSKSVIGSTTITPGDWYQIAGVANQNDKMRLYVNGLEEGVSSVGTLWTGGNAYRIGSNSGDGMAYFSGLIDDAQFYHRALNDSEIKKLYNSDLKKFDSETCWNADLSTFICPAGSHIYQYETKGGETATLKADFERLDYLWEHALTSPTSTISYQMTKSCVDTIQGVSEKCGDGIVGQGEACEIGQTLDEKCETAETDGYDGIIKQKCKADCSGWLQFDASSKSWKESGGTCLAQGKCGDGIKQGLDSDPGKQGPEECDDGKNNGKYGYCSSDCKNFGGGGYCGNYIIDVGKEVCDASAFGLGNHPCHAVWCAGNNLITGSLSDPACSVNCGEQGPLLAKGAKYNPVKELSCSWDCQSYDYCGDGKVNTDYEECEKSEDCQAGVCSGSSPVKYCEKDADCDSNAKCENFQPGKRYCAAPNEFQPEIAGTVGGVDYYKDSTAIYFSSVINCRWDKLLLVNTTCLPLKAPEPVYSPINCGNGKIDTGEVCDSGSANGDVCTPVGPATTCTYCAFGCQQVVTVSK